MKIVSWFVDPIQYNYADFSGRSTREAFWMYTLTYFFLAFLISATEAVLGTIFISVITSFTLMLPSLAITTRRLHDTGLSGWWQLVGFIPFIGFLILLGLLARPGQTGPNQFGEPPGVETVVEPEPEPGSAPVFV